MDVCSVYRVAEVIDVKQPDAGNDQSASRCDVHAAAAAARWASALC